MVPTLATIAGFLGEVSAVVGCGDVATKSAVFACNECLLINNQTILMWIYAFYDLVLQELATGKNDVITLHTSAAAVINNKDAVANSILTIFF